MRRGIFPCSYVEVLSEPGSAAPPIVPTTIAGMALPSSSSSIPASPSPRPDAVSPQSTPPQQHALLQHHLQQQQQHHRRRSSSIHSNPSDGSRPSSTEFLHSSDGLVRHLRLEALLGARTFVYELIASILYSSVPVKPIIARFVLIDVSLSSSVRLPMP